MGDKAVCHGDIGCGGEARARPPIGRRALREMAQVGAQVLLVWCAPSCEVARKSGIGIEGALRANGTHGGDGLGLGFGQLSDRADGVRAVRGWLEDWLVVGRARTHMLACRARHVGRSRSGPEGFVLRAWVSDGPGRTCLARLGSACDGVCLECVCVGRLESRFIVRFRQATLFRPTDFISDDLGTRSLIACTLTRSHSRDVV